MLEFNITGEVGGLEIKAVGSVEGGQCLAVTGPSGCGKTSLLRMLAGLSRPSSGRISITGGDPWFDSETGAQVRTEDRGIGFVFQDLNLFPRMTVLRNLGAAPERAADLLEAVGLSDRAGSRPANLSGGEAQRAAIARALAQMPDVLLLDEPFAALDDQTADQCIELVRLQIAANAIPTVMVAHDLRTAQAMGCESALRLGITGIATMVPLAEAFTAPSH
ncbi:MAG: ATP-binding cassette domain-containing protein [Actinomycetes bacterium]